jgi:quercetin dioxygenase-like cupin family protein
LKYLKIKIMKNKKNLIVCSIAVLVLAAFFISFSAQQQRAVKRTNLQQHDLGTAGLEFVQARIDFPPGTAFGNHSHPGEEIIYVLEGLLEYRVAGKPPVTLKGGEVLFIPAGVVHAARNAGSGEAKELATYVVKKGKPLVVMAR